MVTIAKKIVGEEKDLDESNEFVGAAAAAKVAGEDEFDVDPTVKMICEFSRSIASSMIDSHIFNN